MPSSAPPESPDQSGDPGPGAPGAGGEHALRRRVTRYAAAGVALLVVLAVVGGVWTYRHLNGNITALDTSEALGTDRPDPVTPTEPTVEPPLNILLIGSDTREGQTAIGGDSPGLSDTTILLHLSSDRERAYGVSLPRDAMVERPDCLGKDGETTVPGGLAMFNTAYAVGGPGCTQRTVEQLTGIRVDHFAVIDFSGFQTMVDALDGVPICVPTEVNDDIGKIYLPEGSYEANGEQALDYVRVRHELSANGDIGRMKRQQAFLASMANKAISADTLTRPLRLYNFLDAATRSLTTDPELASLARLADLAKQLRNIGLEQIVFLTVPFETYQPDPNRLVWAPQAERLWKRLRHDEPLTARQSRDVTTAANPPAASPAPGDGAGAGTPETGERPSAEEQQAAELARQNGLCA